ALGRLSLVEAQHAFAVVGADGAHVHGAAVGQRDVALPVVGIGRRLRGVGRGHVRRVVGRALVDHGRRVPADGGSIRCARWLAPPPKSLRAQPPSSPPLTHLLLGNTDAHSYVGTPENG